MEVQTPGEGAVAEIEEKSKRGASVRLTPVIVRKGSFHTKKLVSSTQIDITDCNK